VAEAKSDMTNGEDELTWRCICCGARLGDITPPLGKGEIKCWKCGTMMYLSITPVPSGYVTCDTNGTWYVQRWMGESTQAHRLTAVI
jgi:hypothetical protein